MTTQRETNKAGDRRGSDRQGNETPTASSTKGPDRKDPPAKSLDAPQASETPGQPGLEKEPNRDKAVGPGGQRLPSDTAQRTTAGHEANVPGVDTPDGIYQIDPTGQKTAEETKLL